MEYKRIDWTKPLCAVFSEEESRKAFIVGSTPNGMAVGIPELGEKTFAGIIVEVNDFGNSVKSGKHIIENVYECDHRRDSQGHCVFDCEASLRETK
jgi:hypothetical protein